MTAADIEEVKRNGIRLAIRNAFAESVRAMIRAIDSEYIEIATPKQFDAMLKELDLAKQDAIDLFTELQKLEPS